MKNSSNVYYLIMYKKLILEDVEDYKNRLSIEWWNCEIKQSRLESSH